MNKNMKFIFTAGYIISLLAACGKTNDSANQKTPVSISSIAEENAPHFKKTENFGTVSNIALIPVFQVPAKYSTYVRQEVSEATKEEYRKLPDTAFQNYMNTWIRQAASVEKPDWQMIGGIIHPETLSETNAFKKQEIIEKIKTEMIIDKNQLNVIYGWQGDMLSIDGPDTATGEYYLMIKPHASYQSVTYLDTNKNYTYSLHYRPVFDAVGMVGDKFGMQLTLRVPIEKAKEIEALREGNSAIIRVYGHIKGVDATRTPLLRKNSSEAGLGVEVEAIEIGIRKNGEFKSFFFLDTDQLKRSKS